MIGTELTLQVVTAGYHLDEPSILALVLWTLAHVRSMLHVELEAQLRETERELFRTFRLVLLVVVKKHLPKFLK